MSEELIDFHPRIEDPSKPSPSLKVDSSNSASVVVKCCQVPGMSQNL